VKRPLNHHQRAIISLCNLTSTTHLPNLFWNAKVSRNKSQRCYFRRCLDDQLAIPSVWSVRQLQASLWSWIMSAKWKPLSAATFPHTKLGRPQREELGNSLHSLTSHRQAHWPPEAHGSVWDGHPISGAINPPCDATNMRVGRTFSSMY